MTSDEIQKRRRVFSDHTQAAFKKVMGATLASEWQAGRAL
jgi:hypothetical protein